MSTIFLRLLDRPPDEKAAALSSVVAEVGEGSQAGPVARAVAADSFQQVPTSAFAYWVSESARRLFTQFPSLEDDGRTAKQGLATADDFRFVRLWCEVGPSRTLDARADPKSGLAPPPESYIAQARAGKRWAPFAKGGEYSPYYADIYLVVNWERDGEEIRSLTKPGGRQASRAQNTGYYFRPGLTWSLRTQKGLSVRALPAGCVFGHKGPAIFAAASLVEALLGIANTAPFVEFALMRTTFGSYEVGVLQRTPVPGPTDETTRLSAVALKCVALRAALDRIDEVSHPFLIPAPLLVSGDTLVRRLSSWSDHVADVRQRIAAHGDELDEVAFRLYSIEDDDRRVMLEDVALQRRSAQEDAETVTKGRPLDDIDGSGDGDDEDEAADTAGTTVDSRRLVAALVSYLAGCAFGRWDVRFATGERAAPELSDPFAPLPVCSPGMLQGDDGLPLIEPPPGYPLAIAENGILVDAPGHPDDIVRRVQAVCELIFGDRAEATVREACAILGVKELRDWFRNPRAFWDEHVKRYSRSRRKAPIYWLLQSSRRSYGIWLYYHRLDADLLAKALMQYAEPRLRQDEAVLNALRSQRQAAGATGAAARHLERQIERQEALIAELEDFRDRLARAVRLGLRPDLDDGVLLTIAPLHELVPWKPAKEAWQELLAGKYAWSSIGAQLREKGLVR